MSYSTTNQMNTQTLTSASSSTSVTTLRKCPNCDKKCSGKQCRDCHVKMLEKRKESDSDSNSNCMDCNKTFFAKRADGSLRKRCKECQDIYVESHSVVCKNEKCQKTFIGIMNYGRTYQYCMECVDEHRKNRKKCDSCEKIISNDFTKCSDCFKKEKVEYRKKEEAEMVNVCGSKGCENKSKFFLCKSCNFKEKSLRNEYMTSICFKCNFRFRGDFKFCENCKKK